jgi:amino acid transporter
MNIPHGNQPTEGPAVPTYAAPHLRRVLKLRDLIFYGIVIISPIAPVPLFGVAQQLSRGHAVTTILIAGIAMMLTAVSYGRMAAAYPSAGSAYTYVGRGLNAHLGFLAGWAMSLDYIVLPIVAVLQAALAVVRLVPQVPLAVWIVIFAASMTFLNLRGIRSTARANISLLVIMCIVIGLFVVLATRYLFHANGWLGLISLHPFYAKQTFDLRSIATATSFAALTYIGFDGVTTLAEDVENPRRNVLLATVLVCLFTTLFSCFQVYLAQLVWPAYNAFPNIETAFMDVTRKVGGPSLFQAMGFTVILASFGGGLAGQVAAARLLFGMGRDGVLPRRLFAHLDPKRSNPSFNICLVGVLAVAGSLLLSFEHAAELLNFGAFLAFMGVNLACLKHYYFQRRGAGKRSWVIDALVPTLGFLFCLAIWLNLPLPAKVVGGLWLLGGVTYDAIRTRGFRTPPAMLDFTEG